ncbi:MAG TPA: N-acetylmuramoyl-L-alanine amidase [Betaproteobacteria bacterium]|nr:N-acetylmuramoyl-L-alanine amidase [Betaproteobacteria bacterium]
MAAAAECVTGKWRRIHGGAGGWIAPWVHGAVWFFLLLASFPAVAGTAVSAARIWPAADYTRITLESVSPLRYQSFTLSHPERLVIDLRGATLSRALKELPTKVAPGDPYIKKIRIGYFKPRVVRLVLDLKTTINPSVFLLKPYGQYGNRLVLDIYPKHPTDPLMALVETPDSETAAAGGARHPLKLRRPSDGKKSHASRRPKRAPGARGGDMKRMITVCIDPGHGGEDPGAHGKGGTLEKNVTLAIGRKLKALVDAQPGMRAILTRNGDYFVPLGMRVMKAQRMHANLFVSIHADAYVNRSASGSSVFALSEHGATSAAARWLAKSENESDLIGGVNLNVKKEPYLARTLLDLSQTATINDSLKLGKDVLGQLGDINHLHRGLVEQAGFAVLKSPDIPSILVETAFISNPVDERKLRTAVFQEKVAKAILHGIDKYFANNPPFPKARLVRNP